jgi:hypothetical protein
MTIVVDEPGPRPIRLVVTDDLERARLTVLVRIILAIPHLLWLALWSIGAFVASIVAWFATLFAGTTPSALHTFLASYVRYAVHVSSYIHLGASPYPSFNGGTAYPVDIEIDPPRRQGRWSVGLRALWLLPVLLLATTLGGTSFIGIGDGWTSRLYGSDDSSAAWSAGASWSGIATVAAFLGWFACLARGRMTRGLRDLVTYAIGYSAQVSAYMLFLTDRYPSSDPALGGPIALPAHAVRLDLSDSPGRARLIVFFRLLLALPHLVWLWLWSIAASAAVVIAWLVALVIGRVPSLLHRFLAAYVRYGAHVYAFLLMVGGPFPGFVGKQGSYPVDILIDPPARQRRIVTLFRLVLVFPALLLATGYAFVVLVVAILGWWYALVRGRMPEGLRNLGAVSIRYLAQTTAYLHLVTATYPYSAPAVRDQVPVLNEQLSLETIDWGSG